MTGGGNPKSLAFQAACVREVLVHARTDAIRAGIEGAIETLEKMQRANDGFKAVAAIYEIFPDAEVVK